MKTYSPNFLAARQTTNWARGLTATEAVALQIVGRAHRLPMQAWDFQQNAGDRSDDSALSGRNGSPPPAFKFSKRSRSMRCRTNSFTGLLGSIMLLLTHLCPSQTVTITGDIPYAKALKGDHGDLLVWSMSQIRQDKDSTVVPGGGSVMEKDIRSHSDKLGYPSLRVEFDAPPNAPAHDPAHDPAHHFIGTLDMTGATLPGIVAILVDDKATLTVKEDISSRPPGVTGPAFTQTYPVDGTALWNPRSYKEFIESDKVIPAGRKYTLTLKYENTANLTKKYGGQVDVDGVSVYVCLTPVEVVQPTIADNGTVGNLANVDEVRFCRWIDAFNSPGTLKPNFWKTERDRFRVRFNLGAHQVNQSLSVKLSTVRSDTPSPAYSADGTAPGDYEDNPTEVPLIESTTTPGLYETPDLLLVTDKDDDKTDIGGVNDNTNVGTGQNFDVAHDVTHIGMLGGKLRATLMMNGSATGDATFQLLKPKKKVEIDVVILDNPNEPLPATRANQRAQYEAIARRQLRVAQEAYAQLGIQVSYSLVSQEIQDQVVLDKLKPVLNHNFDPHTSGGNGPASSESKVIMDCLNNFRSGSDGQISTNTVAVYLPVLLYNDSGHKGEAFSAEIGGRAQLDPPPYDGFVFISGQAYSSDLTDETLAHETGHSLGLSHQMDNYYHGDHPRAMNTELMKADSNHLRGDPTDGIRFRYDYTSQPRRDDPVTIWKSKRLLTNP